MTGVRNIFPLCSFEKQVLAVESRFQRPESGENSRPIPGLPESAGDRAQSAAIAASIALSAVRRAGRSPGLASSSSAASATISAVPLPMRHRAARPSDSRRQVLPLPAGVSQARQIDRRRPAEQFGGALARRLVLVECQGQAPVSQDRRKHDDILWPPPVADGEGGTGGQHRVGEQQQPPAAAHPGVERDILPGRQRARLRHHKPVDAAQRSAAGSGQKAVERRHRPLPPQHGKRPMRRSVGFQVIAQIAGLPPQDRQAGEQAGPPRLGGQSASSGKQRRRQCPEPCSAIYRRKPTHWVRRAPRRCRRAGRSTVCP